MPQRCQVFIYSHMLTGCRCQVSYCTGSPARPPLQPVVAHPPWKQSQLTRWRRRQALMADSILHGTSRRWLPGCPANGSAPAMKTLWLMRDARRQGLMSDGSRHGSAMRNGQAAGVLFALL